MMVFRNSNSTSSTTFKQKTWKNSKYFLDMEVAQFNSGVTISQRKYTLDILADTGILDCQLVDTLMDSNVKLIPGQGQSLYETLGDIDDL